MLLKMADTYMGFVLLIVVFVAAIFARAIKITMSSSWYKKSFAQSHRIWIDVTKVVFDPVKRMLFDDLDKHLRILNSDVVEIGIGPGANFDYYPHGTSLIAVDPNPHMEELLKANLEKAGNRVHLKKFVAASADDMSCTGQIGVEDNSVAAVVCTKLLCCLTEDQIRKTLQEVKRVLMPGGRFYFLEHIAGHPWTLKYLLQHFVSKSLLWPTLYDGCRCDRKTLPYIEQGGFKIVQSKKVWANWLPSMFSERKDMFSVWHTKIVLYFVNFILIGFAEKEK